MGTPVRENDRVIASFSINGNGDITFFAEDIRRERSGIHAAVTIGSNGTLLASDDLSISRSEERIKLANSAYTMLPKDAVEKVILRHELDLFCRDLWTTYLGRFATEALSGEEKPTMPEFLLEPYVLSQGSTLLFGAPESGKSWTALIWAVSLDAGLSQFWPVRQQRRTLFLNLERPAKSVSRRLGRVNEALGLPANRWLWVNNARGRSLADIAEEMRRMVKEEQIECIIVDSISRAGQGDLNDNQSANRITDMLNSFGCAWVGLAHTPRADQSHIYGSVHFDAAADLMVHTTSETLDNDTLGVGLQITKKNDIKNYPMQIMAYEFHPDYGLTSVRRARPNEFIEIEGGQKQSMKQQVIAFIQTTGGSADATETSVATGFSRAKVSTLFNSDKAFVKLPKDGKRQAFGLAYHQGENNVLPP